MEKLHWTWKKIVSTILGFLGIGTLTSCYGMPMMIDPVAEYGVPSNKFIAGGVVLGDTDGDNKTEPVKNIQIKIVPANIAPEEQEYYTQYTETNAKGEFYKGWREKRWDENRTFEISFIDVDGAENGAFKTTKKTIIFTNEEAQDSDESWVTLEYSKDLGEITLENEEPSEE